MNFIKSICDKVESALGTTVVRGYDAETGEEHTVLKIRDKTIDGEQVKDIQVVKDTRHRWDFDE